VSENNEEISRDSFTAYTDRSINKYQNSFMSSVEFKYEDGDWLDEKLVDYVEKIVIFKGIKDKFDLNNIRYTLVENFLKGYGRKLYEEDLDDIIRGTNRFFKDNYPDHNNTETIKSKIKFKTLDEADVYQMIDKVKVIFNERKNQYIANTLISNINNIVIAERIVKENMKLLDDGLWCDIDIAYKKEPNLGDNLLGENNYYYEIKTVRSLELVNFDIEKNNLKGLRLKLDLEEWIDLLLRSIGIESIETKMPLNYKIIILMRLLPLVEKNFNLVELGLPGTGKSYLHNELSTTSYLLSGAETTRAQLFYDKAKRKLGIVSNWDVVVFDEVTGVNFDDNLIQYMKSYMEAGKFNANQEKFPADASFIFNGNTNKTINHYLNSSHLFKPLPEQMQDTAFLDRIHCYLPGWEIDFDRKNLFTKHLGLTRDFLFKFLSFLRKKSNNNIFQKHDIELSDSISNRDKKAIKKNFSGLVKLLDPFDQSTLSKENLKLLMYNSIEMRKRVNEQQKRISPTDKFENKEFSFNIGRSYSHAEILPEFKLYRQFGKDKNVKINTIYSHKEMLNINKKLMKTLKTSDLEKIVLNKHSYNFALTLKLNSIETAFSSDKDNINSEAKEAFSQIEKEISQREEGNQLIEKYIKTYKAVEVDLDLMMSFFYENARYLKFYNGLKYNRDYQIGQKDLKGRREDCDLRKLNLNEINVFYRRERNLKSLRCEYGGFKIVIYNHKSKPEQNKEIYYNYSNKIY
jgi:ATP-dependent Lon protease